MAHAIERRLDYVRLLGADTDDRRMDLPLPAELRQRAAAILKEQFGQMPPRLMALHPTGSDPYKWWPTDNFAALGDFLWQTYGASLLIISGKADAAAAQAIADRCPGPTLVTGGRFDLLTVAALLSHCRLLAANDSGPLHMGLALGAPTIALIGADHPARIGPYRVDWGAALHRREEACRLEPCLLKKCPDNVCLKAIKVEEVTGLVKSWWEPRFYAAVD